MADGITFTIQGDPRGASAVGPGGGGLGYGPDNNTKTDSRDITNSVAVKFDIFNNQGEGNDSTGLFQDGVAPTVTGSIDLSSSGLELNSGDVIDATLTYNGTTLTETLTDTATGVSAPTQSYTVNIPSLVGGNTAFVGFTGATGDENAIQDILSWTFTTRAGTTTTIVSAPNPSVFGQAVTFTATVAPTSGTGTPTGTVSFVEGSTTLASSVSLNSSGVATFSTSSLAVGSNTVTANYSGDTTFQTSTGSDSTAPQVVDQASTTTTVTSAPNPSGFNQTVTFTATVAATAPGAGTPTGTVTFLEGTTTLASSVTLNGSDQATFTISSLAVGTHTITADYSGDTDFSVSTGNDSASPQVVNQTTSTTTTVSSAPNPSLSGQTVTFTATVTPTSGTGTPTGTVNFLEGTTTLATSATLNGSDQATFTTSTLTVGSHTITANYSGDSNFTASTGSDSASPQVVQATGTEASTTTVSSTPNPSVSGQTVTFTATVTPTSGTGTPTGTVNFLEGTTTLASSATLNGSDQATFTTSSLAVGSHTITADYSGDTTFAASTGSDSAAPQVVKKAATTTTLASAPNPSVPDQTVTFTATVAATAPGTGTPTGTVNFLEGTTTLASSVTLNGSDQATFTTSSLAVGSHTLTAHYSGDTSFQISTGSDSASPQVVNKASTTTSISSVSNPSVFGQTVTFTASVAPVSPGTGTPTGTVNFLEGSHHPGFQRDAQWIRSGHIYDFLAGGGQPHDHGQLQRRHELPCLHGKRFGFAASRQPGVHYHDGRLRAQSFSVPAKR